MPDSTNRYVLNGAPVGVLHHPNRQNSIYVLSLDSLLTADITERLQNDPRFSGVELKYSRQDSPKQRAKEIYGLALGTLATRVVILDCRSSTLPMLQLSYNRVTGLNRKDLNSFVYFVLVGDYPCAEQLTHFRQDYTPAAFFYDPFILASKPEKGIENPTLQFDVIPPQLLARIKEKDWTSGKLREYLRSQGRKEEKLAKLAKLFGNHSITPGMYTETGELVDNVSMHVYPFFFEDLVYQLFQKALAAKKK
jgi:hypothetical protein